MGGRDGGRAGEEPPGRGDGRRVLRGGSRSLADRDPPARLPAKRHLVRRRTGRIPSPRRPCSRWPRGLTNETNTEGIHAHPRTDPRPPPPPPPGPLTAIWAQLPAERRRRLQRLLAELLARPVTVAAALPRGGRHFHRTALICVP